MGVKSKKQTWQQKARQRLEAHGNKCFTAWCKTKDGKAWCRRGKTRRFESPYRAGFSLPGWHHEVIEALNRDDEETVKGLILEHLEEVL